VHRGPVSLQRAISREQGALAADGLSDQQTLKGVAMDPGQMLHRKAVLGFNAQLLESFTQEAHSQLAGINSESRFAE
jgi:hypothetical protein